MANDLLAMHKAFLAEVADRRQQLQKELDALVPVEDYHRRAAEQLVPSRGPQNGHGRSLPGIITDQRLLDANRHKACEIALGELGGQAKTQEVADWLMGRGYGTEFDSPRVFHNTCYTAMSRKKDTFKKTGPGEWKLIGP